MTFLPGTSDRRRIYLLRHGAVEYLNPDGSRVGGARDVDLTETGREQATQVAELLKDKERLYLTTLERIAEDRLRRRR